MVGIVGIVGIVGMVGIVDNVGCVGIVELVGMVAIVGNVEAEKKEVIILQTLNNVVQIHHVILKLNQ